MDGSVSAQHRNEDSPVDLVPDTVVCDADSEERTDAHVQNRDHLRGGGGGGGGGGEP